MSIAATTITRKTQPSTAYETKVAVIMPARNEGADIEDALRSLADQTLQPVRVIVVVNNSTDDTAVIARRFVWPGTWSPIEVLVMPGYNEYMKTGALNYGIQHMLRNGRLPEFWCHYLLTMDGDTILDRHFLERATSVVSSDPWLGGLSAACLGKPIQGASPWQSLLLSLQRIEYGRFTVTRIRRNVHTMSGAGSLYRVAALNQLIRRRGNVFSEDPVSLVEDYEVTLALKQLGWRVTSNQHCVAWTDLMPTMRMLNAQRFRWIRGTIIEWRRYGWCHSTRMSIAQVLVGLLGIVYSLLSVAIGVAVLAIHRGDLNASYLVVSAFWACYQGWVSRSLGWKVVLMEMALLPEIMFNVMRNYWLLKSITAAYLSRTSKHHWH